MPVMQTSHAQEEVIKTHKNGQLQHTTAHDDVEETLRLIEDIKFFLATAPANWQENQIIRRYYLNNDQGFVSCVFWNNLYYITGTDIVKCCVYRMQKFGREVLDRKKFEEGIFSDLRHLKCGVDATLEVPKSEFLSFLFKNMCLKTQKKQKVFFWFSVPHDKLFADALERDLKRQVASQLPTTRAVREPALSFAYDDKSGLSLYDQLLKHMDGQRNNFSNHSTVDSSPYSNILATTSADSPKQSINFADVEAATTDTVVERSEHIKDENVDLEQDPVNDLSSKYVTQSLVLDPAHASPDALNLDVTPEANGFTKDNDDEDDFPLDYFPVEVEYPGQQPLKSGMSSMYFDNDFDAAYVPLSAIPPVSAGFFENSYFPEEVSFGAAPLASAAHLTFQIPPPMTAAHSQFVTNGDYYASYARDQEERLADNLSPGPDREKYDNEEFLGLSKGLKLGHAYHRPGLDSRTHNGLYHPRYVYPSMEMSPGTLDPHMTRSYSAEDYLSDNAALYEAYPTGSYVPPSSKPYTPGYRLTPIASATPFVSVGQFGSKHVVPPSTKSYPMNPYYQSSPSFQRWGNVHGYLRGFPSIQATSAPQGSSINMQMPNSASNLYFNKSGMVHKPSSKAPNQRPRFKNAQQASLLANLNHRLASKDGVSAVAGSSSIRPSELGSVEVNDMNDIKTKSTSGRKQAETTCDNLKSGLTKDEDEKAFLGQ
ncbi:LADA_0F11694g1_1 [Lachancea dasiensis]|uniref:LADA_0F11694g1_1 n=1 Tax=Lachancea dasiensis TaxID=1072105 RepID=A0A1G4JM78_9SACH|nr:LADA_0F11694g1_1 [Lachancea dasiensis]